MNLPTEQKGIQISNKMTLYIILLNSCKYVDFLTFEVLNYTNTFEVIILV